MPKCPAIVLFSSGQFWYAICNYFIKISGFRPKKNLCSVQAYEILLLFHCPREKTYMESQEDCRGGSRRQGAVQLYLSAFPPTCSLVYSSIILTPVHIMPLIFGLSLVWQVTCDSIYYLLSALPPQRLRPRTLPELHLRKQKENKMESN